MIVRIDGDLIVYRCGFGGQSNALIPKLSHCLHNVKSTLNRIVENLVPYFEVEEVYVYLSKSSSSNFRNYIATTVPYKGNRKDAKRPVYFPEIRQYIQDMYYTHVAEGEEADDLMGIHQSENPTESIIVSWDKDMQMIPGFHYNYIEDRIYYSTDPGYLHKKGRKIQGYGLKWFYAQMLLGDTADNIPGIKGYGPAKVHKVLRGLNTEKEIFEKIAEIYYNEGHDAEYLKEQGRLLWIRRKPNEMWEFPIELKSEVTNGKSIHGDRPLSDNSPKKN